MNTQETKFDKTLEILSIVVLVFTVLYPIYHWSSLPDMLPSHYNIKGQVDDSSSKFSILLLPFIGILVYVMSTFFVNKTKYFNLPYTVKPEEEPRVFKRVMRIMRYIKLLTISLFAYITYYTVQIGLDHCTELPLLGIIILVGMILWVSFQLMIKKV